MPGRLALAGFRWHSHGCIGENTRDRLILRELATIRMQQDRQDVLQFGDFRLDIGERRLLRNDETVPLPPKVFDLLVVLVQNHGRLMEKEDLIHKLWPGTFVEDSN